MAENYYRQIEMTVNGEKKLLDVKPVVINTSTFGNTTLVNKVEGKKIICVSLILNSDVNIFTQFITPGAPNDILTGPFKMQNGGTIVLPLSNVGWFETKFGAELALNLSAANQVGGLLEYVELDS